MAKNRISLQGGKVIKTDGTSESFADILLKFDGALSIIEDLNLGEQIELLEEILERTPLAPALETKQDALLLTDFATQTSLAALLNEAQQKSPVVVDAVIAPSGTISTEIDFSRYSVLSFLTPAAWTDATITIKGSATPGGSKVDISTDEGKDFAPMTVTPSKIYSVDTQALKIVGVHYLALVSSAPQTEERVIKVMLKG